MSSLKDNTSFLLLLFGRLVTNAGDSIFFIVTMWLVYDLTGSTFYTGIAGLLTQVPRALQFLVGPLVDRWELRNVLLTTQLINGTCVLLILIAMLYGQLSVGLLLFVLPVVTFVNQFVYPAQNAALPRIVHESNIVRANSLLTITYKGVDTVFSALGGILITIASAALVFTFNSLTFFVAAVLFSGISVPASGSTSEEPSDSGQNFESNGPNVFTSIKEYVAELREGMDYIRNSTLVILLVGAMFANVSESAMLVVLPAYASFIGGPEMYGLLMAAIAAGSFAGAYLASYIDDRPFGTVSIVGFLAMSVFLTVALLTPIRTLTIASFFLAFIPMGVFNVMFFSMIQTAIEDSFIGRVSSLTSSISLAIYPVGALLGGAVGEITGPTPVIGAMAVTFCLLAVYFFIDPRLRRLPVVEEMSESTLGVGKNV